MSEDQGWFISRCTCGFRGKTRKRLRKCPGEKSQPDKNHKGFICYQEK